MHDPIGPPSADTKAQAREVTLAVCPVCERHTLDGFDVREANGMHQTSYRCFGGHVFIVRWAEVA